MRSRKLAVLAALSPLLFAACGDDPRFFIVQNQVPSATCQIPGERGSVYKGNGRLDVGLVHDEQEAAYRLYPLMQNDLPRAGEPGAVEPNRVFVKGFRVSVRLAGNPPAAARQVFDALAADEVGRRFLAFDEPWAGTLEPGGGTLPAGVTAVPGEVARRLRQARVFESVPSVALTVTVRALGERQAGDIESTEFRFPIDACEGCLVNYLGTCPVAARQFEGHACNLAQDQPVDCCLEGGVSRCPAPIQEKTTTTTSTP